MSRPRSIPTEKQAAKLWVLGSGSVALAPSRGDWGPMLRRGWVETIDEDDGSKFLPPLRITAAGLHALAAAVEFDGLFEIDWKREKPRQLNESPVVTKLKQERDEARKERDDAQRERHYADGRLRKIKYAMEGWGG